MKTTQNDNDVFLAQWLEGEISNVELKKIVPEKDYISFLKIKAGIDVYAKLEEPLEATFKGIKEKIKTKSKEKSKVKVVKLYSKIAIGIAASIALFLSINTFFLNNDVTFQSNFGEQQIVALLDGSEVILNAKSNIKYNKKNWEKNREVYLNGEAFFKVKKGSKFTVVTPNATVTVLGTQFNVNSNKNFFDVSCYQGKVKVVSNTNQYIITPTQAVRNNNGVVTEYTINDLDKTPTWLIGQSSFISAPLSQVINALHKQFNIDFDTSKIDTSIIFTGSFDNKNLEIALASVFEAVGIKYTINTNKITLSK